MPAEVCCSDAECHPAASGQMNALCHAVSMTALANCILIASSETNNISSVAREAILLALLWQHGKTCPDCLSDRPAEQVHSL